MFLGLFGSSSKNPLDDLKETFDSLQKLMDSNKKDKVLLESNILLFRVPDIYGKNKQNSD